jgi:hypothetical protein
MRRDRRILVSAAAGEPMPAESYVSGAKPPLASADPPARLRLEPFIAASARRVDRITACRPPLDAGQSRFVTRAARHDVTARFVPARTTSAATILNQVPLALENSRQREAAQRRDSG